MAADWLVLAPGSIWGGRRVESGQVFSVLIPPGGMCSDGLKTVGTCGFVDCEI